MSQIVTDEHGQQHEFPDEATPEMMMQALADAQQPTRGNWTGAAQGATDFLMGLGQRGIQVREALGIPSSVSSEKARDIVKGREADIAASRGPGAGFDWSRAAGNVGMQLPLALIPGGPVAGGALAGLISGAAQPTTEPGQSATNTLLGGAAGAGGGAVAKLVASLIGGARGAIPGAVEALRKEGVTPTAGQAAGGMAKNAEEAFASLPFAGTPIREAQQRGTQSLNVAAYNRALAPIGEKITPGKLGGEAVAEVSSKLSDAFNRIVPTLKFSKTPELAMEMRAISVPGLGPKATAKAKDIVIETLGTDASLSGEAVQSAQSQLRDWASRYSSSDSPVDQGIGKFLKKSVVAFESQLERQNPDSADALRAIKSGWANYARIRDAASKIGTEDNVFTAAQLQNAVQAGDKSVGKGDFAKGQALMQDLSQPAKQVMSRPFSTSGTTERLSYTNPFALAQGALGYMATKPLYSAGGQRLLNAMLTSRPQQARQLAELIRRSGGAAGLAGSQLVQGHPQ